MNLCGFELKPDQKVLLVGEGNFSFSCCLLKLLTEKLGINNFCNVYASCYQNELSPNAQSNVDYLNNKGAEILLGVDATKLEFEHAISSMKFHKIIFNFPHVGGKMKIHLNRELLRNFFVSASKKLEFNGEVIVTLCSGQGGTGFETVSRRWDDTWQIVEQAAHGSFVLTRADFFPHRLFQDYHPIGYRGREQIFCTNLAVIHIFHKMSPLTKYLSDDYLKDAIGLHPLDLAGDLMVSYCYKLAICNNPLTYKNSVQNYIFRILEKTTKSHCNDLCVIDNDFPYNTAYDCLNAPCIFKGQKSSLRSSLKEVIPTKFKSKFLTKGLVFKKCSSDFSSNCANCQCILNCRHSFEIVKDFINTLSTVLDVNIQISESQNGDLWNIYFQQETLTPKIVASGDSESGFSCIDLDMLCSCVFNLSLRELWSEYVTFDVENKKVVLPSLYPLTFTFDLSFASKIDLDFDEFYHILHQIPDNLIDSVNLLSTFQHEGATEKSYCFRLTYRSYSRPLHRKLAIEIHQNVIGKFLVSALGVRIH